MKFKLKTMLQSKKGQFYILIALLLISYAFQLARQDVPVRKPKDIFQVLYEGYVNEGAIVINNAVYEDANVPARLGNFTTNYLAFARSAEPGFRLVYLFKQGGQLAIGNRLGADINATVGNSSYMLVQNEDRIVRLGNANSASLKIAGVNYAFGFSTDELQFKALFRTSDKLSTRVFVQG